MGEPHEERDRMRIDCSVEEHDIAAVQGLLRANGENEFVLGRILDNVSGPVPEFDRGKCWRVMLGCLLTTQQRSGPDSRVVRFLQRNPFEPALVDCSPHCAESAVLEGPVSVWGIGPRTYRCEVRCGKPSGPRSRGLVAGGREVRPAFATPWPRTARERLRRGKRSGIIHSRGLGWVRTEAIEELLAMAGTHSV